MVVAEQVMQMVTDMAEPVKAVQVFLVAHKVYNIIMAPELALELPGPVAVDLTLMATEQATEVLAHPVW
jgi:hypothetical protein